jgi:phospholipase/carboxylesterase
VSERDLLKEFIHRIVPAAGPGPHPVLVMLHGTGGNEDDLLPLGRSLAPGATLLSPRGRVLENGMPRFFRRFAEGVFDVEDLMLRTHELAAFIERAGDVYEFGDAPRIAVGFSNGANIGASLLLLHPGLLSGAVLFRPMVPFEPGTRPALEGTVVFIAAGLNDALIPPEQSERLGRLFSESGAEVQMSWDEGGHSIGRGEIEVAREWLSRRLDSPTPWR